MRGAEVFMESLVMHDVECVFGNPGTTENSLLDRLIDYPSLDYYVALHEGVAVGAASFYAQASARIAVANLHVAPGLGNAIGMIYGALKASSPLLITAGQQDTRMRLSNPLLSHDLVAMAAPVTKFSAEPHSADELGPLLRRAFKIALTPPQGPVFVALPVNVMEQHTAVGPSRTAALEAGPASPDAIAAAAGLILASRSPCIITGDDPARDGAFDQVVACAETIGAAVYNEGLHAQLSFPNRHPNYRGRLGYTHDEIATLLHEHDLVMLLGGPFFENIWFDDSTPFAAGARVIQIENNHDQLAFNFPLDLGLIGTLGSTMAGLVSALGVADANFRTAAQRRNAALAAHSASQRESTQVQLERSWDARPIHPLRAMHELAAALPDDVVVVDESITNFPNVVSQFDFRRPGDWLSGRGGGIGQGLAGAIGAQVALPDRRVVAISGDGSAMYSIQALWTAVHHALPIIFVIVANREYRILKHNLDTYRTRFDAASNKPYPNMDLARPTLGFVEMAAGVGMPGERVTTPADIGEAVRRALARPEAYLIELVTAGKS